MIKNLTYIQLIFLILQLFVLEISFTIILTFIVVFSFLIMQLKMFSFNDLFIPKLKGVQLTLAFILFIVLFFFTLNFIESNQNDIIVTSLSSLKNTPNLGIFYKVVTILLPVICLIIINSVNSKLIKYLISLLLLFLSVYFSTFVLSKLPLIIFALYFLLAHKPNRFSIIIGATVFILLLNLIYLGRGQADDLVTTISLIIRRVPLLEECSIILDYLYNNGVFDYNTDYSSAVTNLVFNKNSDYIGIAPSLIGSFLLIFNILSPFFYFLLLFCVSKLLVNLSKINLLGSFTSLFLSFELIHTFIDGLPHIYYSTRNGLLFWILILLIISSFVIGKAKIIFSFNR